VIKTTTSVCSTCLTKVPAVVYREGSQVLLEKTCPEHGTEQALLADDPDFYYESSKDKGACGPGGCMISHSCTLMFEITEQCNLTCPTCFTASSPHLQTRMSLEDFCSQLDRLLGAGKRDTDTIQLSGGEPTVHPQFTDFVDACFERGVRQVFVNTNGIELARNPAMVQHLAQYAGRLQVYLQFDGFRPETYAGIRGAKGLLDLKLKAIDALQAAGVHVLPVMTVTRGINLDEVGEVVRWTFAHPGLRGVMLQPAMYAGRYENEQQQKRLTMGELAREVEAQLGLFSADDFRPIPCSDPNCFSMATGLRIGDELVPISRHFPRYEEWSEPDIAERLLKFTDQLPFHMVEQFSEDEVVDQLLDLLGGDEDGGADSAMFEAKEAFFMVGIKPFQDANNYDQDRIDACCVHVIDKQGNPVSLCEYNTLRRPMEWEGPRA
jgi:uncharacterized radical SAM superfamily Fe-S cluster-containing enzyme